MTKKIISIFVPHEGCPHDCIFCNQRKITGVSTSMTGEKAREIIETSLKTIKEGADIEVAFFGGSFTAIDREKQVELLSVANEYKKKGIINDIRMSTRPDCIDKDELELIKNYGASIIELGVQSLDSEVLEKSIRGHNASIVYESSKLIKENGFKLGLQMMVGLPGDCQEKSIKTALEFVKIKPDFVRIYPTIVIKDTGLELELKRKLYNTMTLDASIDIVKKLMIIFYVNNITVIRVGLQSTEEISMGIDIVGGPYHPAYRQLVESKHIIDFIENYIDSLNIRLEELQIETASKNISTIVGNNKSNKIFIKNKYNINMKIKANESIDSGFVIHINNKDVKRFSFTEIYKILSSIYGLDRKE